MSYDKTPLAGLTYAPPYDNSSEIDPKQVQAVAIPSADLEKLEYFSHQSARRTTWARAMLLTIIFGMLAVNMWLTQRNYDTLLINVDQSRLEQAQAFEDTTAQLVAVTEQLKATHADLAALRAEVRGEPVAEPAEVANR